MYKKVLIQWEDITYPPDYWVSSDDDTNYYMSRETCVSCGWVVRETEKEVTIAQTLTRKEEQKYSWGGLLTIPRIAIVEMTDERCSIQKEDRNTVRD